MTTRIRPLLTLVVVLAAGIVLGAFLFGAPREPSPEPEHGVERAAGEAFEKGPHGGRLLRGDGLELEMTIYERGVPPELRVFAYAAGEPVNPREVELAVELARLGGRIDRLGFAPREDYLVGDAVVEEPHSFDVAVKARCGGKAFEWSYASYEGRVELIDEAVRAAAIEVAQVGPAWIRTTVPLTGRIVPNEDAVAHMMPRFPGVVRSVAKRLGDRVSEGELLAVIESNESLYPYEVRARRPGVVLRKNVTAGEFVDSEREIFLVADLAQVWANLDVYPADFPRLRVGQRVLVTGGPGAAPVESILSYLSPVGAPSSQTLLARAELPNPDGAWRPGLFVNAEVVVEEREAPLAVRESALQRWRDWTVVFVRVGPVFEARPIELGSRDGQLVEVTSGLAPGDSYAAGNSFVLKAELGKAGASHDH